MFHPFFYKYMYNSLLIMVAPFLNILRKEYLLQQKKLKFIKTIYLLDFFMLIFPLVDLSVKFLLKKKKKRNSLEMTCQKKSTKCKNILLQHLLNLWLNVIDINHNVSD